MTRQAETFLRAVARFLRASPSIKRKELRELHRKITGQVLDERTLRRWLTLAREPTFSNALPMLRFMQVNEQIVPGTRQSGLFHYVVEPKAEAKKARPAKRKLTGRMGGM